MFDQLRQQSMGGAQDETPAAETPDWMNDVAAAPAEGQAQPTRSRLSFSPGGRRIPFISSLTPIQRFVLAFMLFLNVSVLGCFALLAFGKIGF
jgi:hypothetical protein